MSCLLFQSQRLIELDRRTPYHFAISGKSFQVVREKHPDLLRRVTNLSYSLTCSLLTRLSRLVMCARHCLRSDVARTEAAVDRNPARARVSAPQARALSCFYFRLPGGIGRASVRIDSSVGFADGGEGLQLNGRGRSRVVLVRTAPVGQVQVHLLSGSESSTFVARGFRRELPHEHRVRR